MNLKAGIRHPGPLGFSVLILAVCFFFPALAPAAEFTDGSIRLVLHGETGRFSLYALQYHHNRRRPAALFFASDPRTSFLSVAVNDRVFRMGESPEFRTRVGGTARNPSLIFESYFMQVTKEFSFVSSVDSAETNGVSVRITLENRGSRQVTAGASFLLDTNLGDSSFTTGRRTIDGETLLTRTDRDRFWIDRNDRLSLTGSLFTGSDEDPDSVHFANWRRLNEASSLRLPHQPGRNFNMLPYSVRDSAVSYYFASRPLSRGQRRTFGFYLFVNSEGGLAPLDLTSGREVIQDMPARAAEGLFGFDDPIQPGERYRSEIRDLMARIDTLIASGTATEDELAAIELAMNTLRARYISSFDVR